MAQRPESSASGNSAVRWVGYLGTALALLAVGVGTLVYMIRTRQGPSGKLEEDPGPLVRVFEARRGAHRVAVTAYGTSRASQEWTAIAEVSGRAVTVHERFEPGEILPAGDPLVEIDPTDYQLAVDRCEAEVRARLEELRQLEQTEDNLEEIFGLQSRQLLLAQSEYDRQLALFKRKTIPQSTLETTEDALVARLTAVQETTNRLELIPVQWDLLWASLEVAQTQLGQAGRQLEKCRILVPFAARCASKSIEAKQFVTAGERLGKFVALDTAEVVAMFEARQMRVLFPRGLEGFAGPLDATQMSHRESFWKKVKVPADIRWGPKDQGWVWKGRLARVVGTLDPATRTAPVVFEVPHPYRGIRPGLRPPLVPGAFCEVTAYGATLPDVVVIPRDCLHDGRVYLLRGGRLGQDGIIHGGNLEIVEVEVLVLEEDRAVIEKGIEPGDRVILGDPMGDRMMLGQETAPGTALRGKPVENPARARTSVPFPEDLFEDADEERAGEAAP